jgi:hypothetical protein
MGGVAMRTALVGGLVFLGITVFEQLPVLGWLGGLVSVGAWIWLTNRMIRNGAEHLAKSDNPSVPAMAWGSLVGFITGLVGALSALIVQAGVFTAASSSATTNAANTAANAAAAGAALGTVGASIGLFYWPVFGMIVMGLFGLIWGGRAKTIVSALAAKPA